MNMSMDGSPDYHVDITELGTEAASDNPIPGLSTTPRPWIGIRFDCCNVYTRVYRNAEGTAYLGACPRCGRTVRLRVGPGGTDARFFVAE